MGWNHPEISLEDLLVLIKGFVDMLILASGYQSSGVPALWDVDNIKRLLRWGLFFEDVFKRINDSVEYEGCVKELDAALLDLTSYPLFPKGLSDMSSATLSETRNLVLEHLLQMHPMKAAHLNAIFAAVIEMDMDDVAGMDNDNRGRYMEKLLKQMESLNILTKDEYMFRNSMDSHSLIDFQLSDSLKRNNHNPGSAVTSYVKSKEHSLDGHSSFLIQEIVKRQDLISCISSVESGLSTLLKAVAKNSLGFESNSYQGQPSNCKEAETVVECFLWKEWKSRCLSYLLDKRTIKILSGANLIFSAPKDQWIKVFEQLKVPSDTSQDNLLEIMEICLLGLISRQWNNLTERFTASACDLLPISKQYYCLHQLVQGNPQDKPPEKLVTGSKEEILEYVTRSLTVQPHKLWLLPPVLTAAAIPSWSMLFKLFMAEIDRQFNGASLENRQCNCSQDGTEQHETVSEVADRIRCLYTFHIQSSHVLFDG
uniref:Uncharacterized protein n=1 Tax=Ananas comosus var. bracteatus TaxID=296719 RepID=A0A6V7PJQ3_ANACO|nr:unnamed protein product [Ananas comosus var. bracteatus]